LARRWNEGSDILAVADADCALQSRWSALENPGGKGQLRDYNCDAHHQLVFWNPISMVAVSIQAGATLWGHKGNTAMKQLCAIVFATLLVSTSIANARYYAQAVVSSLLRMSR
jgi:hypothetical protein